MHLVLLLRLLLLLQECVLYLAHLLHDLLVEGCLFLELAFQVGYPALQLLNLLHFLPWLSCLLISIFYAKNNNN